MATRTPDTLDRLRVANPAQIDPDRGDSLIAKAALQRILADPGPPVTSRSRRPRRVALVVALLAVLAAAGAAVAATDPFGWWSPNPNTAMYRIDPAVHVRTPSQAQIVCPGHSGAVVRCAAQGSGQRYLKLDAIRQPPPSSAYSRHHLLAEIAQALAAGKITAAKAARFRADLADVPDSFFSKLQLVGRFATYRAGTGGQSERVPPPGVPEFLVCITSGTALSCQDLNGDTHAPVGAGVYLAKQAPDWTTPPSRRHNPPLPAGIAFTAAERRILVHLLSTATVTHSHSQSPGAHSQASHTQATRHQPKQ